MRDDEIAAMARDYSTWVTQWRKRLSAAITIEGSTIVLDSDELAVFRQELEALSPDAARYALSASMVALVMALHPGGPAWQSAHP
jgi:hypothetical protein